MTQCTPSMSASWKSLRVSRIRVQSGGTSSVSLCRNEKPLRVMLSEFWKAKLCFPLRTAPPRDCATTVMGAASVPCLSLNVTG